MQPNPRPPQKKQNKNKIKMAEKNILLVARLEHIGDKQIDAMVTVTACKLYI